MKPLWWLVRLSYKFFSFQTADKDTPVNPHKSWLQFQNLASTYEPEKDDSLYKTKDGKVVVSLRFIHGYVVLQTQKLPSVKGYLQFRVVLFQHLIQFSNGKFSF